MVCGPAYGMVWMLCGMVCGMVWFVILECCMVWYGMVWYMKQKHAGEGLVDWLDWPSPVEY